MPYSFVDMGLYFFLYSGFGWLFETTYCSLETMSFVNRGKKAQRHRNTGQSAEM